MAAGWATAVARTRPRRVGRNMVVVVVCDAVWCSCGKERLSSKCNWMSNRSQTGCDRLGWVRWDLLELNGAAAERSPVSVRVQWVGLPCPVGRVLRSGGSVRLLEIWSVIGRIIDRPGVPACSAVRMSAGSAKSSLKLQALMFSTLTPPWNPEKTPHSAAIVN